MSCVKEFDVLCFDFFFCYFLLDYSVQRYVRYRQCIFTGSAIGPEGAALPVVLCGIFYSRESHMAVTM